ncbi:MAG: DMT family transporter [Candidatus Hermodarchaeota archaeon]
MEDLVIGVSIGLLSAAFFAIQNVIIKWLGEDVRPVAANSIRMWVSFPLLIVFAVNPFRQADFTMPLETMVVLALSVVFAAGLGDVVYYTSQDRIGVSTAFAIANTYPIATYFLVVLFLGEQFLVTRLIGLILAICGIVVISIQLQASSSEDENDGPRKTDTLGYALAVLTVLMYACATIMIDVGVTDVDPIDANVFRLAFGSVLLAPVFYGSWRIGMPLPSRRGMKIVGVAGIFGMALASTFYVASIKYIGATLGAIVGSTAPLFALPFTIRYLDEPINWKVGIGTFAAVLGVWITLVAV